MQDPAAFGPEFAATSRKVLLTRYRLLPYLYSLFHRSHALGGTVARPLMFEFATDVNTYAVDRQFLWGEALLITPVLEVRACATHPVAPPQHTPRGTRSTPLHPTTPHVTPWHPMTPRGTPQHPVTPLDTLWHPALRCDTP